MAKGNRFLARIKEDENTELMDSVQLYEAWLPIISKLGLPGQCDARDMASKLGQLGLCVVAELAVTSKSDRVRAQCGKDLAHMGGLKPIEKSQNLDVHVMAEAEVDSLLRSKLEDIFGDSSLEAELIKDTEEPCQEASE